jgi:hypothetical protein
MGGRVALYHWLESLSADGVQGAAVAAADVSPDIKKLRTPVLSALPGILSPVSDYLLFRSK